MSLRRAIVVVLATWALLFQGWALASAPAGMVMTSAAASMHMDSATHTVDESPAMPCQADKTPSTHACCCGSHCDCTAMCGTAAISADMPGIDLLMRAHFETVARVPAAAPVYNLQALRPPITPPG
jgi:hypothetical protein